MIAADISFWTFLWYAFAGLVIGVLARLFMPGRQDMNILVTMVLGVVSAILGAILWNAIFKDQRGIAWIGGIVVAVILLWLYSRYAPKTGGGTTAQALPVTLHLCRSTSTNAQPAGTSSSGSSRWATTPPDARAAGPST